MVLTFGKMSELITSRHTSKNEALCTQERNVRKIFLSQNHFIVFLLLTTLKGCIKIITNKKCLIQKSPSLIFLRSQVEAKNSEAAIQLDDLVFFGTKWFFVHCVCLCVCVCQKSQNKSDNWHTRWLLVVGVGITRVENPAARRETPPSDYEGEKGSPVFPERKRTENERERKKK